MVNSKIGEKDEKKIESSTFIYYLAYFSSSLGGVLIGKITLQNLKQVFTNVVWEPNFEG
jgi:hypothetical protein